MGKMARGRQKREAETGSPLAWKTIESCWAFLEGHSKPSEASCLPGCGVATVGTGRREGDGDLGTSSGNK